MTLPVKGQAFSFIAKLDSVLEDGFQVNPTLAVGDFQVSINSGPFVNTALPVVTPAGSSSVLVSVSAAQADGDTVEVLAKDQTSPIEWNEVSYVFELFGGSIEVVNDILEGDILESKTGLTINKKGTLSVLVQKRIEGSLLPASVTVKTTEP